VIAATHPGEQGASHRLGTDESLSTDGDGGILVAEFVPAGVNTTLEEVAAAKPETVPLKDP
jgi:hypothetical protein